jgi:type IV pilus assembly protein PilC
MQMPEFVCRVATPSGEVFDKVYTGADEVSLRRDLENQELMILDVKRRSALGQHLLRMLRLQGGVASRDFLFFNQEMRALLHAGLPIVPALDILLERRKNRVFRNSLIDVRDRVKSGESLSEAFTAQGDLYPPLYSASLASGERSGELAAVLERFVAYLQKIISIRRKVISALIYPAILMILALGLVALMIFFIIPKFNLFLVDFGAELPLITRIVVNTSNFAVAHWQIIVGVIVGSFVLLSWWGRTEAGHYALDRFKLRIPLVGHVMSEYSQNRFTRTLGTLQAGGIPLVTSLELSARAVGNAVYEKALLSVANKVREGEALWDSLDKTGLLSDITVQMVKVGESTGALDDMLKNASDFTDEEIDANLDRLMSLVEPMMLVFMALVVATMLLSIYYPLIQAYSQTTA